MGKGKQTETKYRKLTEEELEIWRWGFRTGAMACSSEISILQGVWYRYPLEPDVVLVKPKKRKRLAT